MAISLRESIEIGLADMLTRKIRTVVTVLGIILGVMSIMVVLAIINGMNQSTLRWMEERGGLNKIEVDINWSMDAKDRALAQFTFNELNFIRSQIPEAVAFNPQVGANRYPLKRGDLQYETSIKGIYPDMTKIEEWEVGRGRFVNYFDINNFNNVVVLGSTAAKELFGNEDPLGQYVSMQGQMLQVIGIMQTKYLKMQGWGGDNALEHMNRQAFVPLTTMFRKTTLDQAITQFEVKANSPEEALKLKSKLESILLNLKQGRRLFEVRSAKEQMDTMKQNARIFQVIFILIAVVSLLVGGIVIMNIMLASVKERTREIGVRLAIGARRMDIFIQFMVQTILITTLGGVIGILLGFMIVNLVGKFLGLDIATSLNMVYVALLVSAGVGLIFGIMPAIRAGNMDPVTALRNE